MRSLCSWRSVRLSSHRDNFRIHLRALSYIKIQQSLSLSTVSTEAEHSSVTHSHSLTLLSSENGFDIAEKKIPNGSRGAERRKAREKMKEKEEAEKKCFTHPSFSATVLSFDVHPPIFSIQ
jgi:hypothetical protein